MKKVDKKTKEYKFKLGKTLDKLFDSGLSLISKDLIGHSDIPKHFKKPISRIVKFYLEIYKPVEIFSKK